MEGHYAMSKVTFGHVLTIMHIVPIPVNDSNPVAEKNDFLEKSVGGCTSYDVIVR